MFETNSRGNGNGVHRNTRRECTNVSCCHVFRYNSFSIEPNSFSTDFFFFFEQYSSRRRVGRRSSGVSVNVFDKKQNIDIFHSDGNYGLMSIACEQIEYAPRVLHRCAAVRRELSNAKNTTKILPCKRSDRTRGKRDAARTHSANDQLDRAE